MKKLNPNWITGFVDAKGCFTIKSTKSKSHKVGWFIQPSFQITLHVRDKDLLLQVKSFFEGVGTLLIGNNRVQYKVRNINEITNTIIPHFDKYPLITQKQSDYIIFKSIIKLMNKGEHLNKEGLIKIINFRASLNKGISIKLRLNFPNLVEVDKPKVNLLNIIDYNWIAGFYSGEGCFFIDISKSKTHKIGYSIVLRILVSQHLRDNLLISSLMNRLGSGIVVKHSNKNAMTLSIYKFQDIYNKIIPIFREYKIEGIKWLDFEDFCKAAELINKKAHLTLEGLEEIQKIKSKMNKARYVNNTSSLKKSIV